MSEVSIKIRDDGPLVIQGAFLLKDGTGAPLSLPSDKPNIALCRCGASQSKPFCDGAHKQSGFESTIRASVS